MCRSLKSVHVDNEAADIWIDEIEIVLIDNDFNLGKPLRMAQKKTSRNNSLLL
jgi:hypothetical protein